MKISHIPFLRTLLLLTFFVGLLGVAKAFLLHKIGIMETSSLNKSTSGSYVWSSKGTPAKYSSWVIDSPSIEAAIQPDPIDPISLSIPVPKVTERVETSAPIVIPIEKETVVQPFIARDFTIQGDLALQAELRLQSDVTYDGRYVRIGYPMGDVPQHIGVCTDVVIRSFRGLGIDLQQRVHEDMRRNFRSYPNNWNLARPDTNIDHRRVPNLMIYFKRAGASLKVTNNPLDYYPGDIVTWDLGHGLVHIGIVSTYVSELSGNPLIVHNIGEGPEMNDMLFKYRITGHYKYNGSSGIKTASVAKHRRHNYSAFASP